MKSREILLASAAALLAPLVAARADSGVNAATQNTAAVAKYGISGNGVIVAILDRGIDYTHADFLNADGTTRIKMMWDMSNANTSLPICDPGQPAPVVYTEAKINAALKSGKPLAERDALGHGTVSTGLAAGNGTAALPTSAQWAGMAPNADLLIVRMVSEYVPAHGSEPEQLPFQGCMSQALDLVSQEAASLGEPIVALMDSGTQWGPIDNSSAVSAKIDSDFGGPGQIYVAAAGDEGTLPNHAQLKFSKTPATFTFTKTTTDDVAFQLWYTGSVPAGVTLTLADTGTSVTVAPGNNCSTSTDDSIEVCTYLPGQQFYPWMSSGPDRAVWFYVQGHSGTGTIEIQATGAGKGTADAYGDATTPTPIISYAANLANGRLTDYSSSTGAIVSGCFNVRTKWVDLQNQAQSYTAEGATNKLWLYSSGGPTRDGRSPLTTAYGGVDITTPGGNSFAAYSPTSYWGDPSLFPFNLIKGGNGLYGRHSATSASAPILVGAVAELLQMNPLLTTAQVRAIIHASAMSDKDTGKTPNLSWGTGKLNLLAATNSIAASFNTNPLLSVSSLTFPPVAKGGTSAPMQVTLSNPAPATDALGIGLIAASSNFAVQSSTCGKNVAAGGSCVVQIVFSPAKKGTFSGTLTFKDFNMTSPQTVALSGQGT
jgi:minor extracellular serine protease Vpr